jgi:hypothetical protein
MASRTFLQAHGPAFVAADFFTTQVWTARGLVTYYTAFVIQIRTIVWSIALALPARDRDAADLTSATQTMNLSYCAQSRYSLDENHDWVPTGAP